MSRKKVLKELFEIQSIDEKTRIIYDYNIKIDGFSNINTITMKRNEKYINIQAISTQNLKSIIKEINVRKKHDENSMDIFMTAESIVEKNNKHWEKLIFIFEQDEYSEKTSEILKILVDRYKANSPERNSNENGLEKDTIAIEKQREIIIKLEKEIKSKDQKNKELTQISKDLEIEIEGLLKLNKDIIDNNESLKEKDIKLKLENKVLEESINTLKRDLEILDNEYNVIYKKLKQMQEDHMGKLYIFGSTLKMRNELKDEINRSVFVTEDKIKDFFDIIIREQDEIIIYKYGITISDFYRLKINFRYKEFHNSESMNTYIRENYI